MRSLKFLSENRRLALIVFAVLLICCAFAHAQNVRYSAPFPSVSTKTTTPYLVANVPPNSPVMAVCNSPANGVPCTNYATTYTSLGVACTNGAQDTPDPQPSACQSTGDAQGNIGFWAPPGQYDYTVCIQNSINCFGPYTVTLGSTSGGGGCGGGGCSVPTGVAIGSALVSSGVSNPPVYQLKPVIDALDRSVTTSGDQAANLTAAWNFMGSFNQETWRAGTFTVASSISPNSLGAYQLSGLGGNGQFGSGTNFSWTGGAAAAFNLDRQRDSILGNFSLNLNGVAGSTGLLISQLTGTSGQISSHNEYRNINIIGINGANSTGIQIPGNIFSTDSGNNNEAHVFWRPTLTGNASGSSVGFLCYQGASNARAIGLYEPEINGTDYGFQMGCGSWHVIGGNTGPHNIALLNVKGSAGGFFGFIHDEGSRQAIVFDPFSNGSNGTFIFMGNRFELLNPDLTKYQWDFSYCNEVCFTAGNYFNTNTNITKMVIGRNGNGRWTSIADRLPNTTIANLPDLRIFNAATNIATANVFSADIASVVRTTGNTAGDGDGLNGLWIGSTVSGSNGNWFPSPGLVVAAAYTDGGGNNHVVPIRFKTLLSDASGTSPAVFKMLPPTDPITTTTYGGPIDLDFQTNGRNFLMNHAKSIDSTVSDNFFGSQQFNGPSACETSFGITTLTAGTTTDTGLSCLPANAIIDAVVYRITTTITTAASFTIGDATTAARFCSTQSTLTAGTTGTCFVQADQTGAAGPRQTAAAKVRVTLNIGPGAGALRLIVYYHTWTAPTS